MKNYIELQGTCWLIQYLNYYNYDNDLFYKYILINRYIRYQKCIELIKERKLVSSKRYILEQLLSFEGSLFDIEDIRCFNIIGKLKDNIILEDIMLLNEKVMMYLLCMFDNDVDYSKEILDSLFDVFGYVTVVKASNYSINVASFDNKLTNSVVLLTNSDYFYLTNKKFYNLLDILDVIDKEINEKGKALVSLDIGKSVFELNKIIYPKGISSNTLNSFFSIDNHYYILKDIVYIDDIKFYRAFTGYKEDEYVFISFDYLKEFINQLMCDKIYIKEEIIIDFFEYMEE